MVHKATHHFDLINWWLGSTAASVRARGRRVFYRPETADALRLTGRGERCADCAVFDACLLKLNVSASRGLTALYADNEGYDGYFRDRCVFSAEIDIEDTMQAQITYENGVVANYLLTAYDAAEGYRVVFHGERGVLTLETVERPYLGEDGRLVRPAPAETSSVVLQPLFGKPMSLVVPKGEGDHGGGDQVILANLFRDTGPDPFGRAADERGGAWSALVGIAANASIVSGEEIRLGDLASDIPRPDIPDAPFGAGPVWRTFDPSAYPFLEGREIEISGTGYLTAKSPVRTKTRHRTWGWPRGNEDQAEPLRAPGGALTAALLPNFEGGRSALPATLNVIFGPCGAGKTTYAHALARREGAVAFVLDEWGARLFGPDVQGPIEFAWMLERLGRCNALIWSTAAAVLAAGTSVVLDIGADAPGRPGAHPPDRRGEEPVAAVALRRRAAGGPPRPRRRPQHRQGRDLRHGGDAGDVRHARGPLRGPRAGRAGGRGAGRRR